MANWRSRNASDFTVARRGPAPEAAPRQAFPNLIVFAFSAASLIVGAGVGGYVIYQQVLVSDRSELLFQALREAEAARESALRLASSAEAALEQANATIADAKEASAIAVDKYEAVKSERDKLRNFAEQAKSTCLRIQTATTNRTADQVCAELVSEFDQLLD